MRYHTLLYYCSWLGLDFFRIFIYYLFHQKGKRKRVKFVCLHAPQSGKTCWGPWKGTVPCHRKGRAFCRRCLKRVGLGLLIYTLPPWKLHCPIDPRRLFEAKLGLQTVKGFIEKVKAGGNQNVELYMYPGEGHGFMNGGDDIHKMMKSESPSALSAA